MIILDVNIWFSANGFDNHLFWSFLQVIWNIMDVNFQSEQKWTQQCVNFLVTQRKNSRKTMTCFLWNSLLNAMLYITQSLVFRYKMSYYLMISNIYSLLFISDIDSVENVFSFNWTFFMTVIDVIGNELWQRTEKHQYAWGHCSWTNVSMCVMVLLIIFSCSDFVQPNERFHPLQ
jgi:hypothetical protein